VESSVGETALQPSARFSLLPFTPRLPLSNMPLLLRGGHEQGLRLRVLSQKIQVRIHEGVKFTTQGLAYNEGVGGRV